LIRFAACEYFSIQCSWKQTEQQTYGGGRVRILVVNPRNNDTTPEQPDFFRPALDNIDEMAKVLEKYTHVSKYEVYVPNPAISVKDEVLH
jgi:hypothetical protein